MALRNLATKMRRIPAPAALRLPSPRVVSPAAGSRALASSSSRQGELQDPESALLDEKDIESASVEKLLSMSQLLREGFDRRLVTLRQAGEEIEEVTQDLARLSKKFVSSTLALSLLGWLAKSEYPDGPDESELEEV